MSEVWSGFAYVFELMWRGLSGFSLFDLGSALAIILCAAVGVAVFIGAVELEMRREGGGDET